MLRICPAHLQGSLFGAAFVVGELRATSCSDRLRQGAREAPSERSLTLDRQETLGDAVPRESLDGDGTQALADRSAMVLLREAVWVEIRQRGLNFVRELIDEPFSIQSHQASQLRQGSCIAAPRKGLISCA